MTVLLDSPGRRVARPEPARSTRRLRDQPGYVWGLSLGVTLQFTAGHAHSFGFPTAPDRVLIPGSLALWLWSRPWRQWSLRVTPVHLAMLGALAWCLASMIWFDRITDPTARFAFVDAFGLQPFVLCLVAPAVFATLDRIRVLLVCLTVAGGYLGAMALFEGLHLYPLLFPRYLYAPYLEHWGRAVGPALQVASNGLALIGCGAAAAVLATTEHGRRRLGCLAVAGACLLGVFFTLTRSLWIGALVGTLVALGTQRRLRVKVLAAAVGLVVAIAGAVLLIPALNAAVQTRLSDGRSADDRLNALNAGIRALESHPLFGVGYQNFPAHEVDWLWQGDTLPVTQTSIAVHNVVVGHAVELGVVGAGLWVASLLLVISAASVGRDHRNRRAWLPLRLGVLAHTVAWITVSMFVPITYSLPCSLLWLLLGLVARPQDFGWFEKEALT